MYKTAKTSKTMQTYTLTEVRNHHGKVFDRAKLEPVLITKQQRPSHVILSAEAYQKLIDHIEALEGETPDTEILEGIKQGMRQALAGEVIPLDQMWGEDEQPRTPGLLQGKLSDTFFEPLPVSDLMQ